MLVLLFSFFKNLKRHVNFPNRRVDIACLQIAFTNIFEAKVRPSCRSRSSGKLAIEYVLGNSSVVHAAYMASYSRLCKDILVWDMVLLGDAQNPSEARCCVCALVGSRGSKSRYHRVSC